MQRRLLLLPVFLLMWSSIVMALKPEPLLVLDEPLNVRLPNNFRTAKDILEFSELADFSIEGMASLKLSGSGQFSWPTLNAAITHMNEPVWIVDLRQESHGFLNGRPVSWYGNQNAENDNKTLEQIMVDEKAKLSVLRQNSVVTVYQIEQKENGVIQTSFPRKINVLKIETQPMLLARMQVPYVRIPVRDHFRPTNEMVDRFIALMLKKTDDVWIHYHCRAGKGRTTTFMVMHDIIHNAKKVSLEDIIKRHHLIGGSNLFGPPRPGKAEFAIKAAQERKQFIEQFYEYARDKRGYPEQSWTAWLAQREP